MDKKEAGRGYISLTLETEALERQTSALEQRLGGLFDGMGRDLSARAAEGYVPVRRVMEDWQRQTERLRTRFSQLGNTLSGAFVIALGPAADALEGLMTALRRTAVTFRSFMYSLMGKKFTQAETAAEDTWTALGGSAAAAGRRVSAAAREVRRSLMDFDQIHRLNEELDDLGGGGGGSGSLSGPGEDWLADAGELIGPNAFGELLRTLIDEGNYDEAGKALAEKLGQLVDSLDEKLTDPKFTKRIHTALSGFTEGINGFFAGMTFREEDRQTVAERLGDLIGDGVGLGLSGIHDVLSGLDWDSVGISAAQFINGGLEALRDSPVSLGTVLADWVNSQTGSLAGFFGELDWQGMGTYIGENVSDWFRDVDWAQLGRALGRGASGFRELITSALGAVDIDWTDILDAFASGLSEDGGSWFEKHPILAALTIGSVKDEIPAGKKTVGGFLARIITFRDDMKEKVTTFSAKLTTFRDALKEKVTNFTAKLNTFKDALKEKVTAFTAKLTDFRDGMKDKVADNFTARLAFFRDELRDKVSNFTARMTSFKDSLKEKVSDFTARMTEFRDEMKGKRAVFTARMTSFTDELRNKASDFQARLTSFQDAMTGKVTKNFTAKLAFFRDELKNKVSDGFQAKLTTFRDALTGKVSDGFQAKLTTFADAMTGKVSDFTANLTGWQKASNWASKGYNLMSIIANLTGWQKASGWTTNGWNLMPIVASLTKWQKASDWTTNGWNLLDLVASLTSWKRGSGWYTNGWDKLELTGYITDWEVASTASYKNTFWSNAGGGVFANGSWKPIQSYASGGFPRGSQLFVAREAGPELVGTLGGHTAVMNNDQIVASVSAGVARAIAGIRFYSREQATPRLAMIGQSVSRSEEHLARLAARTAEESGGGLTQAVELLRQILRIMETTDRDVYLDGVSVKDRVVRLINQNTRATGVCEIIV